MTEDDVGELIEVAEDEVVLAADASASIDNSSRCFDGVISLFEMIVCKILHINMNNKYNIS